MIMLSHIWKCYPTDEYIYDFYSRGIIGVIVHGHVINIYIYIAEQKLDEKKKFNGHPCHTAFLYVFGKVILCSFRFQLSTKL